MDHRQPDARRVFRLRRQIQLLVPLPEADRSVTAVDHLLVVRPSLQHRGLWLLFLDKLPELPLLQ